MVVQSRFDCVHVAVDLKLFPPVQPATMISACELIGFREFLLTSCIHQQSVIHSISIPNGWTINPYYPKSDIFTSSSLNYRYLLVSGNLNWVPTGRLSSKVGEQSYGHMSYDQDIWQLFWWIALTRPLSWVIRTSRIIHCGCIGSGGMEELKVS